ncbi:MAG TPA: LLM class flavin-dependent oxidoreductase [Chloroflexota bacterium]|nr:LLM class flavin-dependent oxidoreductase [Chloroflexota bacterium]
MSALTVGLPGTIVPPFSGIAKNAQRSEAAGAAAIWFPDHLMGFWPQSLWTPDISPLAAVQPSPHVFFDPFVAMAAAGVATSRLQLGTAVTQPLSRHPAHLAQTFLTLSHQTGGRAILGLGAGEAENLEPYGVDLEHAAARVAEAIAIVRLLWSTPEPVSFDGEFWQLRDAVLGLEATPEAPLPPIWLAAHGPRMLRLAGAQADGWLPIKMPPSVYAEHLASVRAAAVQAGRPPQAVIPAAWAFTVIHEDQHEVERLLEHPLIKGVCLMFGAASFERHGAAHPLGSGGGFLDYVPSRLSRSEALAAVSKVPAGVVRDHLFAGTPDQVLSELRALEAAGLRHAVLWNITFLADPSLAGRSFRQLEELITVAAPRP